MFPLGKEHPTRVFSATDERTLSSHPACGRLLAWSRFFFFCCERPPLRLEKLVVELILPPSSLIDNHPDPGEMECGLKIFPRDPLIDVGMMCLSDKIRVSLFSGLRALSTPLKTVATFYCQKPLSFYLGVNPPLPYVGSSFLPCVDMMPGNRLSVSSFLASSSTPRKVLKGAP